MLLRVEAIDLYQQRLLTRKWVQVDDQRFRRHVQLARTGEKLTPQRPHMAVRVVAPQTLGEIGDRVEHQRHQPTDHLQWTTMETRTLRVRTLLVVAARR